jgi:hypothetical protein
VCLVYGKRRGKANLLLEHADRVSGEKLLIRSTLAGGSIRAVVLEPPNTWAQALHVFLLLLLFTDSKHKMYLAIIVIDVSISRIVVILSTDREAL